MHQMFENIAVDGSSSCVPSEVLGEEVVREGSGSERAFGEDTAEVYAFTCWKSKQFTEKHSIEKK